MVFATKTKGAEICQAWGTNLTKTLKAGADNVDAFNDYKNLFDLSEPVYVVLQSESGDEVTFTISDDPQADATITWDEFRTSTTIDLKEQNYLKTEAQCLGVLGDRLILEAGRFNTDGEVYVETYSLLTLNDDGKIIMVEAFTDPQTSSLTSTVSDKQQK